MLIVNELNTIPQSKAVISELMKSIRDFGRNLSSAIDLKKAIEGVVFENKEMMKYRKRIIYCLSHCENHERLIALQYPILKKTAKYDIYCNSFI